MRRSLRGLRRETRFPWRTSEAGTLMQALMAFQAPPGAAHSAVQTAQVTKSRSRAMTAGWRSSTGKAGSPFPFLAVRGLAGMVSGLALSA